MNIFLVLDLSLYNYHNASLLILTVNNTFYYIIFSTYARHLVYLESLFAVNQVHWVEVR